jgi:hypothetical protein
MGKAPKSFFERWKVWPNGTSVVPTAMPIKWLTYAIDAHELGFLEFGTPSSDADSTPTARLVSCECVKKNRAGFTLPGELFLL